MAEFVGAIDQGTTSTRFMVFDHAGRVVASHRAEHGQHMPRPGWIEHDPVELWRDTRTTIEVALEGAGLTATDLAAVGITNQRETTLVWDRLTGKPFHNAIVWQDTRTDRIAAELLRDGRGDVIRERTGLPPSAYFSGGKLQWLLENVDGLRAAAESGRALFGTVDTWLVWNLTGGPSSGSHVTDPTNASRTMLMDLRTLDWDEELLGFFGVPRRMLPEIRPSADPAHHGTTCVDGPFRGAVPVAGVLGDQQAAAVGQLCFDPGDAKNTYGTGNFLLLNTGREIVRSVHGLVTTVAYQLGGDAPVYALEGSVAVTGSAIQWLRDQLGIIGDAAETEALAGSTAGTDGLYFVPAFSGLFAPHWRPDARGAIVGLSRFHTRAHLARAALESICYQSRDVVAAMEQDSGITLGTLRVDGGVTANGFAMQAQADILGIPVTRPAVAETTALGAAYAAGLATGFWSGTDELRANRQESRCWLPTWTAEERADGYRLWHKAVQRTLDWV
jgi:glycerol kinase